MKRIFKAVMEVMLVLLLVIGLWISDAVLTNQHSYAEGLNSQANIISPDIPTAKYTVVDGVKVFKLTAEPVKKEVSKGVFMNAWGYNGSTPGPTIVVNQGDKIRVEVTNHLSEPTSVHWHGLIVPNIMDGVPDVEDSPKIQPGKSFTYSFTVKQVGTFMYHSHLNVEKQEMMGVAGMFISLPKDSKTIVDRVYTLMTQEWKLEKPGSKMGMMMSPDDFGEGKIPPGAYEVNPEAMMWNLFTFNGKQFPSTTPLEVKKGDRVKIRLGNISMESHPIHLHGHNMTVVAKDGTPLPKTAQYQVNTVNIAPGETYELEFVADNPGTWPLHCHLPHHTAGKDLQVGGMFTTVHYLNTPLPKIYQQ